MKPLFFMLLLAASCQAQEEWLLKLTTRETKVEVTVVDEANHPLPNFPCGVGFTWPHESGFGYKFIPNDGVTNAQGIFTAEGRTQELGVGASPEGYYLSNRGLDFKSSDDTKWYPYPIQATLVMKKIINPVPMYAASRIKLAFPAKSGQFGYDLVQREWVAPFGNGRVPDFIFNYVMKEEVVGWSASLDLSFSNPGDGIIPLYQLHGAESELRLPRTAPDDGYEAGRRFATDWMQTQQNKPPAKPALGYIFRVRSVVEGYGKVKNAWYGKIYGEFDWDPRNHATGQLIFTYYLNPDGTRNLEFDRQKNLFKNLPRENTVQRP